MYDFPVSGRTRHDAEHVRLQRKALLDATGGPLGELPAFTKDRDTVVGMYRGMLLTRSFDRKAVELQRTGRLGTFASSIGQEAVGVGVAAAMQSQDVLVPSFREQSAQLWRGVSPLELLLYWGGDERGSDFQSARMDFPVSIPVASHFLHAVGVALAFQLRSEANCAVAIAGDGATSKGDFYEAINLAGAWRLPVLFVVNNNGWAISVPREAQTAAKTLAQKAVAAGIPAEQVDGNDVLAVRQSVSSALESLRAGNGPAMIEALTYRLGDHTTADDASRYRDEHIVSEHWKEEPLARLRGFITTAFDWTTEQERALIADVENEVAAAAESYLAYPDQPVSSMFEYLYETLPTDLQRQRDELLASTEARQSDGRT